MIITLLISIAVVAAIIIALSAMPNMSSCTGDCNQGRNCTCKDQ